MTLSRKHGFILTLLIVLLTAGVAFAAEGKVNTKSLVLRKSASQTSAALQTLDKGDRVTILAVDGSWYKVSYGKYTGYVMSKYLDVTGTLPTAKPTATPKPQATPAPNDGVLRPGDSGSAVQSLQTSLKTLGYYTGNVDGKFGTGTENAVRAFQKSASLKQDGKAGEKTLEAIRSALNAKNDASSSTSSSTSTGTSLRLGATGDAVKAVQYRLKELGYYTGSRDGVFGEKTQLAVIAFQKRVGLTQDGVVGVQTLAALNGKDAPSATSADLTAVSGATTESLDWFKNGNSALPRGAVFTVKDVATGKTFQVRRWAGVSHSDSEPLTSADTATMKEIYGGSWSWNRRAILVSYNGHIYAASMNGMPHGTSTLDNNFPGHFCIHFTGSKTHGTDRVDPDHQAAVQTALHSSW